MTLTVNMKSTSPYSPAMVRSFTFASMFQDESLFTLCIHTVSHIPQGGATLSGLRPTDAGRRVGRQRIRLRWNLSSAWVHISNPCREPI